MEEQEQAQQWMIDVFESFHVADDNLPHQPEKDL
jgi:hypothetical protein